MFKLLPHHLGSAHLKPERRLSRIIGHRNFNPRIVALTLTDSALLSGGGDSLVDDLIANLEDPQRLWDHIVRNQLGETELKLLMLILSFMSDIRLDDLQELWIECGESLRDLRRSVNILDGTMLKSVEHQGAVHIGFHNPSVRDYLVNYVQSDMGEVTSLIRMVRRFEQIEALWLVFPAPGGGPMAEKYRSRRDLLECVASTAFHAEPVHLRNSSGKDYVRRAWLYLEMGKDLGSEIILRLGFKAASDEDTVLNATDSAILEALLQTLSQSGPLGEEVLSNCIEWAVEWIMGDLSDWNLIEEAEGFLNSIQHYDPGAEVSQALALLDSVRDDYAETAFEDWAQTHHDPNIPGSEMKGVIEHYAANGSTAPFDMDEYDTVLQRLDDFDAAYRSTLATPRDEGAGPTRNSAREVESMMQTLRMPSE